MPLVPDGTVDELAQVRDTTDSTQQRVSDFVVDQPVVALALSFFAGILLAKLAL